MHVMIMNLLNIIYANVFFSGSIKNETLYILSGYCLGAAAVCYALVEQYFFDQEKKEKEFEAAGHSDPETGGDSSLTAAGEGTKELTTKRKPRLDEEDKVDKDGFTVDDDEAILEPKRFSVTKALDM